MSPLEITVFLHYATCAGPFIPPSTASEEATQRFLKNGLLHNTEQSLRCTLKGDVLLSALQNVPMPTTIHFVAGNPPDKETIYTLNKLGFVYRPSNPPGDE